MCWRISLASLENILEAVTVCNSWIYMFIYIIVYLQNKKKQSIAMAFCSQITNNMYTINYQFVTENENKNKSLATHVPNIDAGKG